MNYFSKLLVFSFIISSCTDSSKSNSEEYSSLKLLDTVIDLGTLHSRDSITCSILFQNTSSTIPLIINDVKGSCGCITPNIRNNSIQPNIIDSIIVGIKPTKSEAFNKTIVINANTEKRFHVVKIKGTILD